MQPQNYGELSNNVDPYIAQLSQPTFNTAFDVIPLPSRGKVYNGVKPSIKVSYMTTSDENILTSPNLLQSGQFLEILINRKVLEPQLRYKDLLVGDRNAIMIWLRATAYGEMYPVTLFDENDTPFDTEINLNELKIKELSVDPDSEGLFDYTFPISKNNIKFRLMTCGMSDELEEVLEKEKPVVMNEIYTNAAAPDDTPYSHINAVEMMKRRTEEQMKMREEVGVVKHPELAEQPAPRALTKNEQEILEIRKKAEEQMRIRDQHLANNVSQTQSYQTNKRKNK